MPWPKGKKQSPEHIAKAQARKAATGGKRKRPQIFDGVALWECGTCHRSLPASAFYTCKRSTNGLKSQCRECHQDTAIRTRDPENAKGHSRRSEAKRRARLAGCEVHHLTDDDFGKLTAILGERCLSCGASDNITWDHVIPISEHGPHHPTNLQPLCSSCNSRKRTRSWDFRTPEQLAALVVSFERTEVPSR